MADADNAQVQRRVLARWREAGEWWMGAPAREVVRFLDPRGIRREAIRELDSPVLTNPGNAPAYEEDHRNEWNLRVRKVRDEKVSRALGLVKEPDWSSDENYFRSWSGENPAESRRSSSPLREAGAQKRRVADYAPLHLYSGYAFGRSTMLAEEIPSLLAAGGMRAAALADPFSLVGAVEFAKRCKALGVQPLVGASVEMPCGGKYVLLARSKEGYGSLSQLITECHLNEPRQYPLCTYDRLARHARGLVCLTGGDGGPVDRLVIQKRYDDARRELARLIDLYGRDNVFVEIERSFLPWQRTCNEDLLQLAESMQVVPVAGGVVTHARPEHFPAQDVLVCSQTLCTVEELIGRKLLRHPSQPFAPPRPERSLNAERYLRSSAEMSELFADRVDLLENTLRVVERCDSEVLPSRTRMPSRFPDPPQALREVAYAGAALRRKRLTPGFQRRLDHELDRICRLNFADHFLTIWDACRWASDHNILFSGRGSVVDSVTAFVLGLSRIDAYEHNLHFDRFLPEDGSKRPDIDIDFEASQRDAVRAYLTRTYGADRVAGISAIGAYCTRGIVRDVGKALGLPQEMIGFLAKRIHGGISPHHLEAALEKRPELAGSAIPKERFRWVLDLAERLMDVPRNIRAHSSGLVISSSPLAETVPVMESASPFVRERIPSFEREGAGLPDEFPLPTPSKLFEGEEAGFRIIQWDKRSAKYFFDKFDILCLRGQDVLSGTQERIRVSDSEFNVESIALDDAETYRAMRSGELIGIPQSASPAMRQAHVRLRTDNLHDASLVQAGIRPGVGGAVKINELIARRRGKPYTFSHPEFERILGLTYGIIVFQEQVDQLLQTFCGFTSGEAEEMRESIHKRRREDYGAQIKEQILKRIQEQGFSEGVAEQVYEYVAGFKGYGFAQGHALAFAEISIRSIYCQQNYPAEYFAALLTAQPAGYYGPHTLVNEARARGVAILSPCVQRSCETFSVEDFRSRTDPQLLVPRSAIRVGLMQVKGLSKDTCQRILDAKPRGDELATSPVEAVRNAANFSPAEPHVSAGELACGASDPAPQTVARSVSGGQAASSFFEFVARTRPERDELEALLLCGALDALHPNRRAMLWAIPRALDFAHARKEHGGLDLGVPEPEIPDGIADFNAAEKALHERALLDLDVESHLLSFERERIRERGGLTAADARRLPQGVKAFVVGNPIRLRFPPTPSGKCVVFFDLEDETGLLNVTCFDAVYRKYGHAIVCSPYVTVVGRAQDRDGHTAFLAERVFAYAPRLVELASNAASLPHKTADFLVG